MSTVHPPLRVRVSVLAGLALALTATVAAAGPAAKATKLLEESAASALKGFKKETGLHRSLLFSTLNIVDAEVASGAGSVSSVEQIFDALIQFQVAVAEEIGETTTAYREGLRAAITVLGDAGLADDEWPKGFYFGDGGISDRLNADIAAALRKLYAKVDDRLRDSAALLKKKARLVLTLRLRPPAEYAEWAFGIGGATGFLSMPMVIDVALGVSHLDLDHDGRLYLAGAGLDSDDVVRIGMVYYAATSIGSTFHDVPLASTHRWSLVRTSLTEGRYVAYASDDGTTGGLATAISIH